MHVQRRPELNDTMLTVKAGSLELKCITSTQVNRDRGIVAVVLDPEIDMLLG